VTPGRMHRVVHAVPQATHTAAQAPVLTCQKPPSNTRARPEIASRVALLRQQSPAVFAPGNGDCLSCFQTVRTPSFMHTTGPENPGGGTPVSDGAGTVRFLSSTSDPRHVPERVRIDVGLWPGRAMEPTKTGAGGDLSLGAG